MKLSVCIPTIGRVDTLPMILFKLREIATYEPEVILLDDSDVYVIKNDCYFSISFSLSLIIFPNRFIPSLISLLDAFE